MILVNGHVNLGTRCRLTGQGFACTRIGFGLFARENNLLAALGFNRAASVPHGYRGGVALSLAITDGGLSAYLQGSSSISADLNALGNLTSTLAGTSSISSANLAGGINMSASLAGTGTVSNAPLTAFGNLTCVIAIGATPSAFDIAQAVWGQSLDGFTATGTASKTLKDKLTKSDFIGLS